MTLAGAFFCVSQISAAVPQVSFVNPLLFQGDTLVAQVSEKNAVPLSASFDNRDLSVFNYGSSYRIVGPIKVNETAGYHVFSVKFKDGSEFKKNLFIRARKFPLVDLGIPEKLGETPEQLVQSLAVQNSQLDSIVALKTDNIYFSKPFGLPLSNNKRIVAPYGEMRKTGDQQIRHMGIDFGSPKGSAVAAMNGGIVREAENDPIYGNTVIVDHGAGIFSIYMHLDAIKAKVGQSVNKSQVIGTVGETGYATGPHLHLSLKVDGVSVDPVRFVNIFK
jgi:murein DD-endopeptidase MepM/ murein hydrolase activator NlpD